jgi:hypothetical protein
MITCAPLLNRRTNWHRRARVLAAALFGTLLLHCSAARSASCTEMAIAPVVYLYTLPDFGGRCVMITESVEDLRELGINDQVLSIKIYGDAVVTLYRSASFRGARSTFTASDANLNNDRIRRTASSVLIVKTNCDGLPGVYLYDDRDFKGRCSRLLSDKAELSQTYVLPNAISAVEALGEWRVQLYSGERYGGQSRAHDAGVVRLSLTGAFDNNTESIRIMPAHMYCNGEPGIYLYRDIAFNGTCTRFTGSAGDLSDFPIGAEQAESIAIVGPYRARLSYVQDGRRISQEYDASAADLGTSLGRNRATSLELLSPEVEVLPVLRVQLRITTADEEDAGTDDPVLVSLNERNYTWINYGVVQEFAAPNAEERFKTGHDGNDFKRNGSYTYDLLTNGVGSVSDIKWLALSKTGSDGWCVKRLELYVNNHREALFDRGFARCVSLDNAAGARLHYTIGYRDLRDRREWQFSNASVGLLASYEVLEEETVRRIHAAVGHNLHGTRGYWGQTHGRGSVELERKVRRTSNERTGVVLTELLEVDLDVAGTGPGPDPEIDVNFDLVVSCTPREIKFSIQNVRVDSDFDGIFKWLLFWAEDNIDARVLNHLPSLGNLEQAINLRRGCLRCTGTQVLSDKTLAVGLDATQCFPR